VRYRRELRSKSEENQRRIRGRPRRRASKSSSTFGAVPNSEWERPGLSSSGKHVFLGAVASAIAGKCAQAVASPTQGWIVDGETRRDSRGDSSILLSPKREFSSSALDAIPELARRRVASLQDFEGRLGRGRATSDRRRAIYSAKDVDSIRSLTAVAIPPLDSRHSLHDALQAAAPHGPASSPHRSPNLVEGPLPASPSRPSLGRVTPSSEGDELEVGSRSRAASVTATSGRPASRTNHVREQAGRPDNRRATRASWLPMFAGWGVVCSDAGTPETRLLSSTRETDNLRSLRRTGPTGFIACAFGNAGGAGFYRQKGGPEKFNLESTRISPRQRSARGASGGRG